MRRNRGYADARKHGLHQFVSSVQFAHRAFQKPFLFSFVLSCQVQFVLLDFGKKFYVELFLVDDLVFKNRRFYFCLDKGFFENCNFVFQS